MKAIIVYLLVLAVICVISAQSKLIQAIIFKWEEKYQFIFVFFFQKDCGENENWNECGSACQRDITCQRLGLRIFGKPSGPTFCTLQCVPRCECAKGYVRRTSDMKCILPEDCWAKPIQP
jgi:hypothetical protein